jgi:hypothetical protein
MLESLNSRKFLAYIVTVGAGICLHLFSSKGLTSEAMTLLLASAGAYSAANLLETHLTSGDGTAVADSAPSPISQEIKELQAAVDAVHAAQLQNTELTNKLSSYIIAATQPTVPTKS